MRINNIELRRGEEFVCWYPNEDYNMQEQMLKNGSFREGEWIVRYNHGIKCSKHINCFRDPESCYVFAFLNKEEEGIYQLRTVRNRLIELKTKELKDFLKIY
jgi:hypothetical protein